MVQQSMASYKKQRKRLTRTYQKLPLRWKINLSFVSTCLGIWLLGAFSSAYVFSQYLEKQSENDLQSIVTRLSNSSCASVTIDCEKLPTY
ncbi:MAG: hypothetical protein ABG776_01005 [Cyanobacteria bacterium J06555_13]